MPKSGTLQKLGGKKKEDWQEVAVTLDERGLAWESQGAGGALRDKVGGSQKLLTPDQLVSASPCSILGVEHCFEVASTAKGGKVYKFSAGSDADADAWLAALEQTLSGGAPAQTSNPLGSPGPAMEVEQAGGPGVAVEPSAPPPELAPPTDTSAVAALETTPGLMLFGKPISKQALGAALVLVLICVVVMASGSDQTDGGDATAGSAAAPSNPFGGRQSPAVRPPPPSFGGGRNPCAADAPFEAEVYFGTELPAGDACTGAEGHGSDGADVYCFGDTARPPVLDDGTGFSTGRTGGMDYGWDCDGDTNVDFSAGRRAPPRETYGLNHFDRYGECVGSPTNWQLAVPNGAYQVDVDFAADSRGWDGAQCSELHVGEDAVAFLTV